MAFRETESQVAACDLAASWPPQNRPVLLPGRHIAAATAMVFQTLPQLHWWCFLTEPSTELSHGAAKLTSFFYFEKHLWSSFLVFRVSGFPLSSAGCEPNHQPDNGPGFTMIMWSTLLWHSHRGWSPPAPHLAIDSGAQHIQTLVCSMFHFGS